MMMFRGRLLIAFVALGVVAEVGHAQSGDAEEVRTYRSLSEALSEPSEVTRLDLSRAELTELPRELTSLGNLQVLSLSGNSNLSVDNILDIVARLPKLRELDLSAIGAERLPESIGGLAQLEILNLHGNRLSSLPQAIARLQRLRMLFIGDNRLTVLPPVLGKLTSLEVLSLEGNQELDEASLRAVVGDSARLRELSLAGCGLRMVPDGLRDLPMLSVLDLSKNSIVSIPAWIGELKGLTIVRLEGNGISDLTESFCELANLEVLRIDGTRIGTGSLVPCWPRLRILSLRGVPGTADDAEELRRRFRGVALEM